MAPQSLSSVVHSDASEGVGQILSSLNINIKEDVPLFACFLDFMPKLDGKYLFRDYETTLQYVKIACDNTARVEAPLYALWLLSEKVEDLANLFDGDLNMGQPPWYVQIKALLAWRSPPCVRK